MEEISNKQMQDADSLQFTDTLKQEMLTSAKWGKFIAILGFIVAVIIFISSIVSKGIMDSATSIDNDFEMEGLNVESVKYLTSIVMMVLLIVCAIIEFVVSLFLFKASKNIVIGINNNKQTEISKGIHNLKIFTIIMGVLTTIGFAISIVNIFSLVIATLLIR